MGCRVGRYTGRMPNNDNASSSLTTLPLDRQGGARYSGEAPLQWSLVQPRLRYLDLAGCPQLVELDLSACAEGLHLTLRDCPQLRRIRLPVGGGGAVVHLDAGATSPALQVLGAIRRLDACWQGGEFEAEARKALAPFANAAVGLSTAAIEGAATGYQLLVLTGAEQVTATLALSRPLRHLIVQQQSDLQQLSLAAGAAPIERVQLSDCPALVGVACRGEIQRLQISDAPALAQLCAGGHTARLTRCGSDKLELGEHRWQQLGCVDSSLSALIAPQVERLLLRDCPQLRHAELAPAARVTMSGRCCLAAGELSVLQLDEQAMAGLLARAGRGDLAALRTLRAWCGQPHKRRQVFDTVRALAAVAQSYPDPQELWLLRCLLHAAHGPSRSRPLSDQASLQFAQQRWRWLFPEDLTEEGWRADLRLWLACRERIGSAKGPVHRAGRALTRAENLLAITAVANLLLEYDEHDATRAHLRHLLAKGLRARPNPVARKPDNPALPHRTLERLLQALIAVRDAELAQLYVRHLPWRLTPVAQLPLLARLAAVGHAGARAALLAHAQKFGKREPALRSQALALALQPVHRQLFAATEEIALNA